MSLVYHVALDGPDGFHYDSESADEAAAASSFFLDSDLGGTAEARRAFRNLPAGAYEARVRAVDGSGQRSAPSAPVTFTVAEGPLPFTPLDLAAETTGGGIVLTYRLQGLADSVVVYRGEEGGPLEPVAAVSPYLTAYVDRDLEGGVTYTYRLAARLDGAESELAAPVTATAPDLIIVELALPDPDYAVQRAFPYDLDGDGREDVVVSARNVATDEQRVFYVPGTPTGLDVGAARAIGGVGGTGWGGIHVADWDRDVGPDLIGEQVVCTDGVCTENQAHVWTLIPGTLEVGREYAFALPPGSFGNLSSIASIADFDLDGRADFLVEGTWSMAFVGWTEPGFEMTFDLLLDDGQNAWKVTRLDYDQDGLLDVLVPVQPTGAPVVFRNNGDRSFTEVPVGMSPETGYYSAVPFWFDDDAYPDLLLRTEDGDGDFAGYAVYTFDEAAGAYSRHPIGSFGEDRGSVRPVLLNGDGYVDFAEVVDPTDGPSRMLFWTNEENASLSLSEFTLPHEGGLTCLFNFDADGDGVLDVVYCQGGRAALYVAPVAGEAPPPPDAPTGLAVEGDPAALEVTWDEVPSGWALPGHTSYGLVLTSAADTLVVGEVTADAGTPRAAFDSRRPHAGRLVLRDLAPGAYALRVAAVDPAGRTSGLSAPLDFVLTTVGVEGVAPLADALAPVYPNPSRDEATVALTLARSRERVRVAVYDVLGRRVALLHDGPLPGGVTGALALDTRGLASGTYLVRAEGEGFSLTRRFTVVR